MSGKENEPIIRTKENAHMWADPEAIALGEFMEKEAGPVIKDLEDWRRESDRSNQRIGGAVETGTPEQKKELLSLIGDPNQVASELDEFRQRQENFDPGADEVFILSNTEVDLHEAAPSV